MTEKTTNAAQLIDHITTLAVLEVKRVNQGKRMSQGQWLATVEDTVGAMLTAELDRLAQEDPATAERITAQMVAGLEEFGRVE